MLGRWHWHWQWLASSCRLLAYVCTGYAGGMFLLEVVNRMLPYVENSSVIAVFCLLILLLSPRTQGEEILLMLFVVVSQVRHGLRFPDAGYLGRPGCGPNETLFQLSSRACFAARVSSLQRVVKFKL